MTHSDGDGWVECELGHRHWGRHGAAGLLVYTVDDAGVARVLMQHRAAWSHHGDTWGLVGGARDSHEDAVAAALREADEEAALSPETLAVREVSVDEHRGWSYTTVLADTPLPLATTANRESHELRWVPVAEVDALPLHPGFARTWPGLRAAPRTLVVDAANVVGSVPDGWWRDRAGAARRLVTRLEPLRGRVARTGDGSLVVVSRVVAVVEGAAVGVVDHRGWVDVVAADGAGDDTVVRLATELPDAVVVTADRGLRARLPGGVPSVGPGWLTGLAGQPTAASDSDT